MMVFVSATVGELVYSVVSLFREDERNRKDREREYVVFGVNSARVDLSINSLYTVAF